MNKLFSLIIIISLLLPFYTTSAAQGDNYFIVTAYYSPLPDQNHYITGNFEDEVILNGQGIAGASGRNVFSGMLAAPKKYSFGTKIYLKGLGIGSVEDRGGAIVPAGQRGYSYDRIDVWMGYGDEGLRRAMYWGKRKVYGYTVDAGNTTSLDYKTIPAPEWATNWLKKQVTTKKLPNIFDVSLGRGSDSSLIAELENILVELDYLPEEKTNSDYDEDTINAVYDFQIEHNIVSSASSPGAGSYGPKTRKKLKKIYTQHLEQQKKQEEFLNALATIREKAFSKAEKKTISLEKPVYGEISGRVRELQKTLALLGYFEYKDTAIFGVKTKNSLYEYQIDNQIISSIHDLGAGTFGPSTRAQFTKDLHEIYFQEFIAESGYSEEYKNHIHSTHPQEEVLEENVSYQTLISQI